MWGSHKGQEPGLVRTEDGHQGTMATQAPRQAAVILAAWAAVAAGQDTTPCEAYNVDTGSGVCNGVPINVGSVICADGFDKSKCFASMNTDGRIVTYFFRVCLLYACTCACAMRAL